MPEPNSEILIESMKHNYDLFKHLTTLSTGSIVVIATFLSKNSNVTVYYPMVNASAISFAILIFLCIVGMYTVTIQMEMRSLASPRQKELGNATKFMSTLYIFSLLSFFIGILFLVGFIYNM